MVSETLCFCQLGEGYVCYFCGETKKGYVLLQWHKTATTEEHVSKWGSGQEKKSPEENCWGLATPKTRENSATAIGGDCSKS